MININTVIVAGNLTRDPELKTLENGNNICTLGIATNRAWTDKEGNKKEETEYHNIVVFGRQAENTAKYLTKGSTAAVEGRLQTRSWEADGVKHYRTEIIADRIQFGAKKEPSKIPNTNIDYPQAEDVEVPF